MVYTDTIRRFMIIQEGRLVDRSHIKSVAEGRAHDLALANKKQTLLVEFIQSFDTKTSDAMVWYPYDVHPGDHHIELDHDAHESLVKYYAKHRLKHAASLRRRKIRKWRARYLRATGLKLFM